MATKKTGTRTTPRRAPRKKSVAPPPSFTTLPVGKLDSPDQIRARVDKLVAAWEAVSSAPDPKNLRRLAELCGELEAGARAVREQAEVSETSLRVSATTLRRLRAAGSGETKPPIAPEPPAEGKQRLFDEEEEEPLAESFDVAAGEIPQAAPPDGTLQSFFEQVSTSVLKAQQKLDLASLAYSQQLTNSPIPPAMYSMPKVTAEIKIGLSADKGSNLLVTLFGKPENTTNFSESTVSFDIVASPPPPGGTGAYSAPVPSFYVVGLERDNAAAVIRGISATIKAKTGVDLSSDPATWMSNAILLRADADAVPAADRADFLLLKRSDTPAGPVIAVRFSSGSPQNASILNLTDAGWKLAIFDMVAKFREWEASVTLPAKT